MACHRWQGSISPLHWRIAYFGYCRGLSKRSRDDLEPSLSKQYLVKELVENFKDLNRRANLTRDIIKTERRMHGIRETLRALESREAETDQDPLELYRESMNFVEALERTERDLLRMRRGRGAVQPTLAQAEQLQALRVELKNANQKSRAIVRSTGKRTAETQPKQASLPQEFLRA